MRKTIQNRNKHKRNTYDVKEDIFYEWIIHEVGYLNHHTQIENNQSTTIEDDHVS